MIPAIVKVILGLAAIFGVVHLTLKPTLHKGEERGIPVCSVNKAELRLKEAAQKALDAICSKCKLSPSKKRAARGQHVFNNGLLGFHRSVLQHLLRDVGGYDEQLENLMQDLISPLSQTVQNYISSMVAHFSLCEYVDYNADVYGAYVMELRNALVAYLKAETSQNERYGINKIRQLVQQIATQMVTHEVYVDPMARDRWLQENPRDVQQYEQVISALKKMFNEILQDFSKVADKIRDFRRRNNWSWDRLDRSDIK